MHDRSFPSMFRPDRESCPPSHSVLIHTDMKIGLLRMNFSHAPSRFFFRYAPPPMGTSRANDTSPFRPKTKMPTDQPQTRETPHGNDGTNTPPSSELTHAHDTTAIVPAHYGYEASSGAVPQPQCRNESHPCAPVQKGRIKPPSTATDSVLCRPARKGAVCRALQKNNCRSYRF